MRLRLLHILVFLIVGVVLTVSVAWSSALWSRVVWGHRGDWGYTSPQVPCWQVTKYESATAEIWIGRPTQTFRDVPGIKGEPWDDRWDNRWEHDQRLATVLGGPQANACRQFSEKPDLYLSSLDKVVVVRRGWPLSALESETTYSHADWWDWTKWPLTYESRDIEWGLAVDQLIDRRERVVDEPILPLHVIWIGLILDILFYSVVSCVAYQLFRHAIRMWRAMNIRQKCVRALMLTLLSLGATVVVSWASVLLVRVEVHDSDFDLAHQINGPHYEEWVLTIYDKISAARVASWWHTDRVHTGARTPPIPPDELLPDWATYAAPTVEGEGTSRYRLVDARGWPMYAMRSDFELHVDIGANPPVNDVIELQYGIRLPDEVYPHAYRPNSVRVLPLGIIWPGLVLNTIFYWWIWLGLYLCVSLAFHGRSRWRRRKGQCAQCGYDLREIEAQRCPECGWGIRK